MNKIIGVRLADTVFLPNGFSNVFFFLIPLQFYDEGERVERKYQKLALLFC